MKVDTPSPDKVGAAAKNLVDVLTAEMNEVAVTLLPAVQEYLKDIRGVRMAIEHEVRDIIRASQQIKEITKIVPELTELGDRLQKVSAALTPEFIEKLQRLIRHGD